MSNSQPTVIPAVTTRDWLEVHDHTATSSVIIHAPHGGSSIPDWSRPSFSITDEELAAEQSALEDHLTDRMAREVVVNTQCSAVISTMSRFVIDVERFDSPQEEMLEVGMGMLYTHGTKGQRIREISPDLETALRQYYLDYGMLVTDLVAQSLSAHGQATIIDLHSYPAAPLPYEQYPADTRPPLSVGYEDAHITPHIRTQVREAFDWLEQGDNLAFKGSYVPLRFLNRDHRVRSVMLEIRRDQYLAGQERIPEQFQRITSSLVDLASSL